MDLARFLKGLISVSHCLWNQLPDSFCQPYPNQSTRLLHIRLILYTLVHLFIVTTFT